MTLNTGLTCLLFLINRPILNTEFIKLQGKSQPKRKHLSVNAKWRAKNPSCTTRRSCIRLYNCTASHVYAYASPSQCSADTELIARSASTHRHHSSCTSQLARTTTSFLDLLNDEDDDMLSAEVEKNGPDRYSVPKRGSCNAAADIENNDGHFGASVCD